MAMVTNFFVGANSGEGFQNLFSEVVDLADTYDLMVLKGGPGVGKNTFMREIGRCMEAAGARWNTCGAPETRILWMEWCCPASAVRWWTEQHPT